MATTEHIQRGSPAPYFPATKASQDQKKRLAARRGPPSAHGTFTTVFYAAQVLELATGDRVLDVPLSRKVSSLGVAQRILKRARRAVASAYLVTSRRPAFGNQKMSVEGASHG